ncbi:hypothetical protein [Azospirillum melinis]
MAGLGSEAKLLDPWNGSGTTTAIAKKLGYAADGFDLNPAMVVIAKARLISSGEAPSLLPIASDLLLKSKSQSKQSSTHSDPLALWFCEESVPFIRGIDFSIRRLLIDHRNYSQIEPHRTAGDMSELAAFFYTALFRVVRRVLAGFLTSNPTWTKVPKTPEERISVHRNIINEAFLSEVRFMADSLLSDVLPAGGSAVKIGVASSEEIPCGEGAYDLAVTSPPYCTRIDYAVATMPELSVLGIGAGNAFDKLRRKLIGNSTVPKVAPEPDSRWGDTCISFLSKVKQHPSKASGTYYYKNHVQYFSSLYKSVAEVSRSLRPGGKCVVVVQDSFYKDIHNDLPQVVIEMGTAAGMSLTEKREFSHDRTMRKINTTALKYRADGKTTESVLWLKKVAKDV